MNKKTIFLIISIILIFSIGVTISFAIASNKTTNIISISGSELLEKLKNKETFILIRTQDGCHHCEEYKPVLNRVLTENNINAYELNTTKLRNESDEIKNEIEKLFNISGTPTTIFINEGTEKTTINRLVGTTTYSNIKEKLKEQGFIN